MWKRVRKRKKAKKEKMITPMKPIKAPIMVSGFRGLTISNQENIIKNQIKKDNNIIYGAQSIKKHIGPLARPTQDYDVLSLNPRKSAKMLKSNLNKEARGNFYFAKAAQHEGTYKVKDVGIDGKRNTYDDVEVADFTIPSRKVKTVMMDNLKYTDISESIKDKRKALADKQFAYRHAKDRDDLSRIKLAKELDVKYR